MAAIATIPPQLLFLARLGLAASALRRSLRGDAAGVEALLDDRTIGAVRQLLVGSDKRAAHVAEGHLVSRHQRQSQEIGPGIGFDRFLELVARGRRIAGGGKGLENIGLGRTRDLAVIVHFAGLVLDRRSAR